MTFRAVATAISLFASTVVFGCSAFAIWAFWLSDWADRGPDSAMALGLLYAMVCWPAAPLALLAALFSDRRRLCLPIALAALALVAVPFLIDWLSPAPAPESPALHSP
jgi:hypothetical protein